MNNPTVQTKENIGEATPGSFQRMNRKKAEPEKVETRQETKDRWRVDRILAKDLPKIM